MQKHIARHPSTVNSILSTLSTPSSQMAEEQNMAVLEPYIYVASSPGKGFRSQLIKAFNHWLRVPSAQLETIVCVVERLHNASLLMDDVEDSSELRRGKPAAHKIYGVSQTINTANYVYFLACQEALRINQLDLVKDPSNLGLRFIQIINEEMIALQQGQGCDLFWRDHFQCPTEDEYIQMAKGKTGGLLRMAVRLMTECARVSTDVYVPIVDMLGVWFQIRDDYMNLQSNEYTENKGFAEDLTEGKFSFPIIHGIREKPDSKYILNVLQKRPTNSMVKRDVILHLKEATHSFEYTLNVLNLLEAQVRTELTRLGGNPKLEAILDMLSVSNSKHHEWLVLGFSY